MSGGSDPVATLRDFVRAKRTGTVSIREEDKVAEVRLAAGNIEDASFLGIHGEKGIDDGLPYRNTSETSFGQLFCRHLPTMQQ